MEKNMARKRKGFRRVRGDTTQSVEAVNSRKNQQPDEPIRLKTVEGFWSLMDRKYYKALGIATIEFAIAADKQHWAPHHQRRHGNEALGATSDRES